MNWIDRTELDSLLGEFSDSGGLVMFVNCASVTSRPGLDSAIRRSVPLDPRIEGYLPNWDGLQDSMFGGLHQTEAEQSLIVFSHARSLRNLSQNVLTTLSDVLTSVASQLAEPKPGCAAMRLEFVFHDVP